MCLEFFHQSSKVQLQKNVQGLIFAEKILFLHGFSSSGCPFFHLGHDGYDLMKENEAFTIDTLRLESYG